MRSLYDTGRLRMKDTLWRTMSRSAPAMLTPAVKASLIVHNSPYRIKATKIERSVSNVRSFLRFKLLQMRERNFMGKAAGLEWWSIGVLGASPLLHCSNTPSLLYSNTPFFPWFSFHSFRGELALVQIQYPIRPRRGVRIVRHHQDCLALLA